MIHTQNLLLKSCRILAAGIGEADISSAIAEIYGYILGISTAIAMVTLAFMLIRYMTGVESASPKALLELKTDAIHVIEAWIILNSLGGVIMLGMNLFKDIEI